MRKAVTVTLLQMVWILPIVAFLYLLWSYVSGTMVDGFMLASSTMYFVRYRIRATKGPYSRTHEIETSGGSISTCQSLARWKAKKVLRGYRIMLTEIERRTVKFPRKRSSN